MNNIEKLQASVLAYTGRTMYYESLEELNREMDYAQFPCAYAFLLDSTGLEMENGRLKETFTMAIFFTNLTQFDYNSIDNEDIINDCKKDACKFILGMQNDANFELVSVNSAQRVYEPRFDNPLTGYGVNITIKELIGISACDFLPQNTENQEDSVDVQNF